MKNITRSMGPACGRALFTTVFLAALTATAWAAGDVGSVVTIRGDATIQREGKSVKAGRKSPLQIKDIVQTKKGARMKMLFIDESMLTLGPDSKASIEQFVYSKEGGGASIFNLLDGKMRTIVGKTAFKVHTTTSVAAARGTIIDFETGRQEGKPFTTITCIRGLVDVTSSDPNIGGMITLGPGQFVRMFQGEAPPNPEVVRDRGPRGTGEGEAGGGEEGGEEGGGTENVATTDITTTTGDITTSGETTTTTELPPVEQEPVKTTPVKINLQFP